MTSAFVKWVMLALITGGLIILSPLNARTDVSHPISQATPAENTPPRRPLSVIGSDGWTLVYERVPYLPLENHYISSSSGDVAETNTLASRLIRYHTITKGRLPIYRLDWKLTLADYLGVNEVMDSDTYPGWDMLRTNPMDGDVAAIRQLNRAQRDGLVNALVEIFNTPVGQAPTPVPSVTPSPSPTVPNSGATPSGSVVQPRPGAADLLLP